MLDQRIEVVQAGTYLEKPTEPLDLHVGELAIESEEALRTALALPIFDDRSGIPEHTETETNPWRQITWEQLSEILQHNPRLLGQIRRFEDMLPAETKAALAAYTEPIDESLWATESQGDIPGEAEVRERYGENFGRKGSWRHGLDSYDPNAELDAPPHFFDSQGEHGLETLQRIAAVINRRLSESRERLQPDETVAIVDIACGAGQLTASLELADSPVILNDMNSATLQAAEARLVGHIPPDHLRLYAGRAEAIEFDDGLADFLASHKVKELILVSSWGLSYLSPAKQLEIVDKWNQIAVQNGIKIRIMINSLTQDAFDNPDKLEHAGKEFLIGKLKTDLIAAALEARWRLSPSPDRRQQAAEHQQQLIANARATLRSVISIRGADESWDPHRRKGLKAMIKQMFASIKKSEGTGHIGQKDFSQDLVATQPRFAVEELTPFWQANGFTVSEPEQDEILFGQSVVYELTPAAEQ